MSNKKCCEKKNYICHEEYCEPGKKRCCNGCCHKKCNPCHKEEPECCKRREECYCSERKWCVRPCKTCCYYWCDPEDPSDPEDPPIIPPIIPPVDPCKSKHKKCYKCCVKCCDSCCDPCCNDCCNRYEPCCDLSCSTCYPCHHRHDPKPDPKPKCGGLVPQSFAALANNQSTTVPARTPLTFNQVGTGTNDICLTSASTILVKTAGTYNVAYSVGINTVGDPKDYKINLYVNFEKQPNGHHNFSENQNCVNTCMNIVRTQQVNIPQNAVITLMNDSQNTITTCQNGTSPVVLTITRVK